MIVILLFGFLAYANAAPRTIPGFHHRHDWPFHHHGPHHRSAPYFSDEIFDTGKFWQDLSEEMNRFDEMFEEFTKHFPSDVTNEGIEGDQYKIILSLSGFDEKDITVKAREGVLMVQAVHKTEDGNERNYLNLRTLPTSVNVNGSWSYKDDVLRIIFPLTEKPNVTTKPVDVDVTEEPQDQQSREEMEHSDGNDNKDADVGLQNGSRANENELLTNEIPRHSPVEATTYAVDLKNEVEFVPVRY